MHTQKFIGNLSTVNCGTIKDFEFKGKIYQAELLGKGYTSHLTNIVVVYFVDKGIKTSICYYKNKKNEFDIDILKFKTYDSSQNYYYKKYRLEDLPKKYAEHYYMVHNAYFKFFGK